MRKMVSDKVVKRFDWQRTVGSMYILRTCLNASIRADMNYARYSDEVNDWNEG
jgi:hypothetical protein